MTTLTCKFEPRATADGKFGGYGSVFGNVDTHGDTIEFGAFGKSLDAWRNKGRAPHMFLMHGQGGNPFSGSDLPIGRWTLLREDRRGLYLEGEILCMDTDQGRQIAGLMRGGVLCGLSIGFRTKGFRPGSGRIKRTLTEIDLFEVSLVTEPSNPETFVAPISDHDVAYDKLQAALAAVGGKASVAPKSTATLTTQAKTYDEASAAFGAAIDRLRVEQDKR